MLEAKAPGTPSFSIYATTALIAFSSTNFLRLFRYSSGLAANFSASLTADVKALSGSVMILYA